MHLYYIIPVFRISSLEHPIWLSWLPCSTQGVKMCAAPNSSLLTAQG